MRRQELSHPSHSRREDVGRITVGVDFDPTPLRYVDLQAVFDPERTVANPATFNEEEASRTIVDHGLEMSGDDEQDPQIAQAEERETESAQQDESYFDCDRYARDVDDGDEYGESDSDADLPADEEEPEQVTARGQDAAIPIDDDEAEYDTRARGDSLYADDENDEPCDDLPYVPAPRPLAAHESLVLLARKAIAATGPTPTPMATTIPIPMPLPPRPRLPEAPASLAPLALDSLERYTNAIPPAPYASHYDVDATFASRRNIKKRIAFIGAALGIGALVSIIAASEMSRGDQPEEHAAVATRAASPDLEMQKRDQLQATITHAVPVVAPDVTTHAPPASTPSPWAQNILTKHAPPTSHAKDAHATSASTASTASNDDNAKAAQALSDAQLTR